MKRLLVIICLLITSQAPAVTVIHTPGGKQYHTGLRHRAPEIEHLGRTHVTIADCDSLPAAWDLKEVGVELPIKNQANCGSCWAFSKSASLESSILAASGKKLDLSEQELVSCDRSNYGCNGGNLNQSEYQVRHGQGLESDFPYQARGVACRSIPVAAKGTDFVNVGQAGRRATVREVQCALYKSHTIPWITASANSRWGSFPSDPNAVVTRCGSGQTNHAIGITGWKTVNGKVYFHVRNSWGTDWAAAGYTYMPLGCDNLGEEVAYIMTDVMPCIPPKVKLPVEVSINAGDEVVIAVKEEQDVSYIWTVADREVGRGSELVIAPGIDTIYKVSAKNNCGTAESSTRVKIIK